MDSHEFNKIAMAILGTIFVIFGVSIVTEAIFHSEEPEEAAYVLAEVEESGEGGGEEKGPAYDPVTPLLASADPAAGETVFKKCASCHTVEQGGPNKVGPNLWGVVKRPIAAHEGFSYSAAMKEFGDGKQWTYEDLNGFLWKPKSYVKGTIMGFAGLKDAQDRADVIMYLRSNADNPEPLPEVMEPSAEATQEGQGTDVAKEGDAAPESGAPPAEPPAAAEEPGSDAATPQDAEKPATE